MNFFILFSLFTLIVSAPANVLVVTKVKYHTVIVGDDGTETQTPQPTTTSSSSTPITSTITKTLTRTETQDGTTQVEETEVKQTVTTQPAETTSAHPLDKVVNFKVSTNDDDTAATPATTTSATTSATPTTTTPATTTPTTKSSTTSSSSSTSTGSSETGGSGDKHGQGTYYSTGLGACGITNQDSDYIVAISHGLFDETNTGNPNNNPVCGKKIKAFYEGKSVEVTVTDRCEGCAHDDLDFSPSAFSQLADKSLGRIDITWEWAN